MPTDLATSRLVYEMGFPQDNFPQFVWPQPPVEVLRPIYVTVSRRPGRLSFLPDKWFAAPELLSGDPKHPGALEFIESLGYSWSRGDGGNYYAWTDGNPYVHQHRPTARTPHGLIAAVHEHWLAQQANVSGPPSGRSNVS